MFLSVSELEIKKLRFDVAIPPGEIEYIDNIRQAAPVEAQGEAELLGNTLGEIRVRGHLKTVIEADCDRCLEPSRFPIDAGFDLFYRPAKIAPSHAPEVEIDGGEAEIAFYDGGGLQLEEILREFIVLSLPMQKVCREDCRGICPACGQNRNAALCACTPKQGDDRWAALKNIHPN